MRRVATVAVRPQAAARGIVGVAPVLSLGLPAPALTKEAQVKRNTNIALDLIKKYKGAVPAAYERKYPQSFDEIAKEIEALLGSSKAKQSGDDQPMERMAVIERCLRQSLWNYLKDEGKPNFREMEKWLTYTAVDESSVAQAKRAADLKEKAAALKQKNAAEGKSAACLPAVDWAAEYAAVVDREIVAEKRHRYNAMAVNTADRDEALIEALQAEYRKPTQSKRLDGLVEMLNKFKPIIAREAIMQRLTIKHLEGQLGTWRYLDWNPEVRDRAETEADNGCWWWWYEQEEKRMAAIRLRTKNEVTAIMEKEQAKRMSTSKKSSSSGSGDKKDDARARLLAEVIMLQQRKGTDSAEAAH